MVKGVQQGNWQGARFSPFGYTYSKEKKLLEIEQREADIVKLIYTMYLADKSTHEITEYLNKKKYQTRTGKQFYTKFIGDILKNRIYTGKIVWNKKRYDKNQKTKKHYKSIKNDASKIIIAQGKHASIIDEQDFEEVQKLLAEKKRTWRPRVKNKEYLLTGLLTCAKCNHKYNGVSSISNHRTNKKKRWYRCSGPYANHIRCTNRSVKAEDIEPEVIRIVAQLIQNDRLKQSRWMTGTSENLGQSTRFAWDSPYFPDKISKTDMKKLKNRIKTNLKKQSKLTDAYLENLLGEDVFRGKIEELRKGEDELKILLAGYELREIETERSEGYINRVKDFLDGYDERKTKIDFATKKVMCGLLFKNITLVGTSKIAPAIGGARPKKRIAFALQGTERNNSYCRRSRLTVSLFPPFNFLFSEQERKSQCQQNQRLAKIRQKHSASVPTDAR